MVLVVVVVDTALRGFPDSDAFPWQLRIGITCRWLGDNGMPTSEEVEVVTALGESTASAVDVDGNAVFLARITARGERGLLYRVHDPEQANDSLQQLLAVHGSVQDWEFQMEYDPDWYLAKPELDLPPAV